MACPFKVAAGLCEVCACRNRVILKGREASEDEFTAFTGCTDRAPVLWSADQRFEPAGTFDVLTLPGGTDTEPKRIIRQLSVGICVLQGSEQRLNANVVFVFARQECFGESGEAKHDLPKAHRMILDDL